MANYVQNEKTDFAGRTAGQPPIMLARLPHVGAAPLAQVSSAADQKVIPPEAMPQLDLRTEIEQRTRLHLAATSGDDPTSSTTLYVDRQHAPRPELSAAEQDELHPSQTTLAKPSSLGETLFQLHSQLAPHAGLVVAMALIASAGLLYWMIAGPAHTPLPNYQTPGFDRQPEGFGATSNDLPQTSQPAYTAGIQRSDEPTNSRDEWNPMTLPDPLQPDPLPNGAEPNTLARPEAPLVEMPVTETLEPAPRQFPQIDEIQFPETGRPQNLDFTAIRSDSPAALPQPIPAVAQRTKASSNR